MLVEQRNNWRKELEEGRKPDVTWIYLDDYRKNRDSDSWRMASGVEQLCEYILYLEDKVDGISKERDKDLQV